MPTLNSLQGRRILLGITGSIAAYKAPQILRILIRAGAQVEVVLTENAKHFIGAETFRGLGASVHTDIWGHTGELHIELARRMEAALIAPATADTIARIAEGRADDLLSATLLCSQAPIFLAPAMHPAMFAAAATQQNVSRLLSRGVQFLGPVEGEVASGDSGLGRMEEPENLALALAAHLEGPRRLSGRRIVITAGPTVEPIDPVRSLTNTSSGKMGFALAEEAAALGAQVTLIAGPVSLPTPPLTTRINVTTALQMRAALAEVLGDDLSGADVLIMAAAVSDYRPERVSADKLKRTDSGLSLRLAANPDLLRELGAKRRSHRPVLVGFALETEVGDALIQQARRKLIEKQVDLVVANSAADSLGLDTNQVLLVTAQDCRPLGVRTKPAVATAILDWIARRLETEIKEWTA